MPRFFEPLVGCDGPRITLFLFVIGVLAFGGNDKASGQDEGFREEGLELPLLEDLESEIREREERDRKPAKKKKKRSYPYDRIEAETTYRFGHDDNVFNSASIPVPGDTEVLRHQSDFIHEGWFDFEYDHYTSPGTKFSLDYFYKGEFYEQFRTKERQRNTVKLQWQERLDDGEYLRAGIRESRRLANAHSRFGEKFDTDFDYYRTDLFLNYEFDLSKRDEVEIEYRLVQYNYDENPTGESDDWLEHRLGIEWDRELAKDTTLTFFGTQKWRSYREELARQAIDGEQVLDVDRSQDELEFGVQIEKDFETGLEVELEVSYEDLADEFQDYYSYNGLNFEFEIEYPITEKIRFEADGRLFKREHEHRRFLASRLPNPSPPPSRLDPLIGLYEDYLIELALYYECSEKLEIGVGWNHRWYHVDDPTEAFRANEVFFQLRYFFKKTSKS